MVNRSLPYVIFGAISLVIGVFTLLLPETKGLPIPATIQQAIDLDKCVIYIPESISIRDKGRCNKLTFLFRTKIDITVLWRKRNPCCRAKGPASTDASNNSDATL